MKYTYSTTYIPINLSTPLWKVRSEHIAEWQEILKTLEESPKEVFRTLISLQEIKSFLPQSYSAEGEI